MKEKFKKKDTITGSVSNDLANYQLGFVSNDESVLTKNSSGQFHNLNVLEKQADLRSSLPREIQLAIKEWAESLSKLS